MNKISVLTIYLVIGLCLGLVESKTYAAPNVGSVAPDFSLQDQNGKMHSLKDYKGKWLVMYFYPKDRTSGCTIEAGEFRDNQSKLAERNATVVGISLDDVASHLDFANTLKLNFDLLADDNKKTAKSYQVLTDLGLIAYTKRETFIIDPQGTIAHHFKDVDPKTHAKMVLSKLDNLIELYK